MKLLKTGACSCAVLTAVLLAQPAAAMSRHDWNVASRVGEVGLGLGAIGLPAVQGDMPGVWQAGGSIVAGGLTAEALKQIFPKERPDGSGNDSFPSGHTSISFAAAASMHQRYGWQVGVPATLVATFVGVARVKADKHHWYDVVAGAAIGEASGFLITKPYDQQVRLLPWGDAHSGGMAMSMHF